jgi:hypothetical protein
MMATRHNIEEIAILQRVEPMPPKSRKSRLQAVDLAGTAELPGDASLAITDAIKLCSAFC